MNLTEVRKLAKELFKKHNLIGWKFKFDNSKKRFGVCKYLHKTISLSKPLTKLNSVENVNDTLLHEIAHALCGRGVGHSNVWKRKAVEIGCNGVRCYKDEVELPKGNLLDVCPNCYKSVKRFRKPKREKACRSCCNKYNNGEFSIAFMFVEVDTLIKKAQEERRKFIIDNNVDWVLRTESDIKKLKDIKKEGKK